MWQISLPPVRCNWTWVKAQVLNYNSDFFSLAHNEQEDSKFKTYVAIEWGFEKNLTHGFIVVLSMRLSKNHQFKENLLAIGGCGKAMNKYVSNWNWETTLGCKSTWFLNFLNFYHQHPLFLCSRENNTWMGEDSHTRQFHCWLALLLFPCWLTVWGWGWGKFTIANSPHHCVFIIPSPNLVLCIGQKYPAVAITNLCVFLHLNISLARWSKLSPSSRKDLTDFLIYK